MEFQYVLIVLGILSLILYIAASNKAKSLKNKNQILKKDNKAQSEKIDFQQNELGNLEQQVKDLKNKNSELETNVQDLSKYQGIVEIDKVISEKNEIAFNIVAEAREEADKTITDSKEFAKESRAKTKILLENSQSQATTIIENANKRAEEIAGEALEAKRNADHYAETEKAIKNIIKGYGKEYMKPTHSLVDDLAEEYSYKEAGVELKNARERTKLMIQNNTAANCDYVEKNRKETAEVFVLDAFNGKVEAILSRAKTDNFGKLEQEIKDSFSIVNENGRAFRNAVITQEYLKSRMEELQWIVRVHVLREEEREEQRRIKEAIREEERARREFERAKKEAEKEEKLLQKAMEKVQKQFDEASEAERAKYEEQLNKLKEQLTEAEANKERALSMAQQTKRGHVYVISNIGSFGEDIFKIGLTRRLEPMDRVKELGDASVPFEFDVHAMISSDDAPALENKLHQIFKDNQLNKVNPRKEFFKIGLKDIREVVDSENIEIKWTMKAEAREYRESLALVDIDSN